MNTQNKTLPNIKDKLGRQVHFGDKFLAKMMTPSFEKGTLVTVVEDVSKENLDCERNYDVEDAEGNRLWNAYMVIRNGVKLEKGQNEHTK